MENYRNAFCLLIAGLVIAFFVGTTIGTSAHEEQALREYLRETR